MQRHRTRTKSPATQDIRYRTFFPVGSWSTIATKNVTSYSEDIVDVVTADYRKRIARGDIINNPCTYTKQQTTSEGTGGQHYEHTAPDHNGFEYTGPATVYRREGYNVDLRTDIQINLDSSFDRVKLVALANVDATPYAFGEDLFEAGETIRFLKAPLRSLLNLTGHIHKFTRGYSPRKLSGSFPLALSNAWLTYRFAATPLVRSVTDLLKAQSDLPHLYPNRRSARGHDMLSGVNTTPKFHFTGNTYLRFSRDYKKMLDKRASILYEVSNPVRDWRFTYGLRGKDLPNTLWQILPYSFMIDRLVDVSSFIKAATSLLDPRVRILAGSTTSRLTDDLTYRLYAEDGDPAWAITTTGETRRDFNFTYVRTPWLPSFTDTIPRLTPRNLISDATHVTDLITLIFQKLGR